MRYGVQPHPVEPSPPIESSVNLVTLRREQQHSSDDSQIPRPGMDLRGCYWRLGKVPCEQAISGPFAGDNNPQMNVHSRRSCAHGPNHVPGSPGKYPHFPIRAREADSL